VTPSPQLALPKENNSNATSPTTRVLRFKFLPPIADSPVRTDRIPLGLHTMSLTV
jgi:hypothetical protein